MRDFIRRLLDALNHRGPGYDQPTQTETNLRATLTLLADRWEQCAKSLEADLPQELFVEEDTSHQWAATVAHNLRRSATDLREVLRTSRIPNGWMTAAEEEQHGTPEATS